MCLTLRAESEAEELTLSGMEAGPAMPAVWILLGHSCANRLDLEASAWTVYNPAIMLPFETRSSPACDLETYTSRSRVRTACAYHRMF